MMGGSVPKQQVAKLAQLSSVMQEKLREGGSVTFSPRGSSMLPMLRAYGDKVTLIEPPARMKTGTVALFILKNPDGSPKFVLHRLVRVNGSKLTFCGDRRLECDPPVDHSDVLGVVSDYVSRGRRHTVKEPLYRLYSFWMVHTVSVRKVTRRAQDAVYGLWKKLGFGKRRADGD